MDESVITIGDWDCVRFLVCFARGILFVLLYFVIVVTYNCAKYVKTHKISNIIQTLCRIWHTQKQIQMNWKTFLNWLNIWLWMLLLHMFLIIYFSIILSDLLSSHVPLSARFKQKFFELWIRLRFTNSACFWAADITVAIYIEWSRYNKHPKHKQKYTNT